MTGGKPNRARSEAMERGKPKSAEKWQVALAKRLFAGVAEPEAIEAFIEAADQDCSDNQGGMRGTLNSASSQVSANDR